MLTRFRLLIDDSRGYVLSLFELVWLANMYMSLYGRLRVDIRAERAEADAKETEKKKIETEVEKLKTEVEGVRANGPKACPTGLGGPFDEASEPAEAESRG